MRYCDRVIATAKDVELLSLVISARISDARAEIRRYNLGVAILTPVLLGLSIGAFFLSAFIAAGKASTALTPAMLPWFCGLFFCALFGIFLVREGFTGASWRTLIAVLLQLFLSNSALPLSHPTLFWIFFGMVGLVALAIMGHADATRAPQSKATHFEPKYEGALECATVFPTMLQELMAVSVDGAWLHRGLDRNELLAAAGVIYAAANHDMMRLTAILRAVGTESARRIIAALIHLHWLTQRGTYFVLSSEAEEAIGVGA